MKKRTLVIVMLISVLLSACSSKKSFFEFKFDEFYGYFFTENTFVANSSNPEGLGYSIIKNDIKKIYQKTNGSGYVDNIIIVKKETDKTLKEFVETLTSNTDIEGYKSDSMKSINIICNNEKIPATSINSKVVGNLSTTYFHYSFFKQDKYVYIVSFASQDESERNTFSANIKNIKCRQ